jgi:undecaprenyl-phosphate 4-deoxy-4-formamido-L-arabinose transferase
VPPHRGHGARARHLSGARPQLRRAQRGDDRLRHARGAFIINMDDDLQNPPEEVVRLYDHCRLNDWDVVYTRYAKKEHEGWRNLGSRFANRVADTLLDKPPGLYLSSFRCISALVAREVTKYDGPYPISTA